MEELKKILTKFAESGWDLIEKPSKDFLSGRDNKDELIAAVKQADSECGSCGCELDELYKRALVLLEA